MFVLYTHHTRQPGGRKPPPPGLAIHFIFQARPSFSSRIPVCQSGDAGAMTAGRTNFSRRMPRPADCNPAVTPKRPEATSGALPPSSTIFPFPDEVRKPAGLLHRTSWFKSMLGSHYFLRTRGSQRSRLIRDQEKPGAKPGCPTLFIPRQIAQTD